jgi:hypothetical protein
MLGILFFVPVSRWSRIGVTRGDMYWTWKRPNFSLGCWIWSLVQATLARFSDLASVAVRLSWPCIFMGTLRSSTLCSFRDRRSVRLRNPHRDCWAAFMEKTKLHNFCRPSVDIRCLARYLPPNATPVVLPPIATANCRTIRRIRPIGPFRPFPFPSAALWRFP